MYLLYHGAFDIKKSFNTKGKAYAAIYQKHSHKFSIFLFNNIFNNNFQFALYSAKYCEKYRDTLRSVATSLLLSSWATYHERGSFVYLLIYTGDLHTVVIAYS